MPTPREAYVNDVQRQGTTNARLRPADFASGAEQIGRAAQGLGEQIGRTAEVVEDIQLRDAQTAAQEADNVRMEARLSRLYEGPEGYFNQEGKNALLDKEKLDEDLRRIDEEAASSLSNKPHARRMYDRLTQQRNRDTLPQVFQHASKERTKMEDAISDGAINNAINEATLATDPEVIEKNIATVGNLAVQKVMRKGILDDTALQNARMAGVGTAVAAIAQKLELTSPAEAQAFVTTHAGQMDPNDAAKLMSQLAPGAAQERAGSDVANFLVYSGQAFPEGPQTAPTGEVSPTDVPPRAAVKAAVIGYETPGGKHTDASGNLITSYAGAQGAGQIMPKSGADPGYGVKPLQNNSREEHIRFSGDLIDAYTKHFDENIVLGLTAYNWGPGNLEAHIKKVGKPGVNGMTDAQFIATLPRVAGPNEGARTQVQRYAADVLSKSGVSVRGAPGPAAGQPVIVGREVDLEATINNIRQSDRTYVDKQALIAEATRMHSYGKQIKAEAEEALGDDVQTEINKIPVGDFKDLSQLPLTLRQKLPLHPELYNSVRNMAHTNKEAAEAELDKKKKVVFEDKLARLEQDLYALSWNNPDAFQKIDFYTSPAWAKMGSKKVTEWMERQQKSIESGQGKGADHGAIRTMVGRYTSKEVQKDEAKMGLIYQTVTALEERMLNSPERKGKPLSDTEREALVMQATAKATYTVNGKTTEGVRAEAAAAGAAQSEVNIYDHARAQLQLRWGRVPLPAEVEAAVQQYRRSQAAK